MFNLFFSQGGKLRDGLKAIGRNMGNRREKVGWARVVRPPKDGLIGRNGDGALCLFSTIMSSPEVKVKTPR